MWRSNAPMYITQVCNLAFTLNAIMDSSCADALCPSQHFFSHGETFY